MNQNYLQNTAFRLASILVLVLCLFLGLTFAIVSAIPDTSVLHVSPNGIDNTLCGSSTAPCATVQHAVNIAEPHDSVWVAQGTYEETITLSKTVSLLGGFEDNGWDRDILTYRTVISGNQAGSVISIINNSEAIVEGFDIVGGQTDLGAGIYIENANPTVTQNRIYNNSAVDNGGGVFFTNFAGGSFTANELFENEATSGSGIYITDSANPLVENNTIRNNVSQGGHGGGIFIGDALPTIINNLITENETTSYKHGAGVFIGLNSTPLVISNTISYNQAKTGWGGGIYVTGSDATISYNDIHHNQAGYSGYQGPDGGGIHVESSTAVIQYNHIHDNTAYDNGGGVFLKTFSDFSFNIVENNSAVYGYGDGVSVFGRATDGQLTNNEIRNHSDEGIHIWGSAQPLLKSNIITNNQGGGVLIVRSSPTLDANLIIGNSAELGGGIRIEDGANPYMSNNVITDNQAETAGSGVYIQDATTEVIHTTIARNNGSANNGIFVGLNGHIVLTNTILVDHEIGVSTSADSSTVIIGVLWHNNNTNTNGFGTLSVANALSGNPTFANDGYHLTEESPAINNGVETQLKHDVDAELRPSGLGSDLGADEFMEPTIWLPIIIR